MVAGRIIRRVQLGLLTRGVDVVVKEREIVAVFVEREKDLHQW